MCIRDRCIGTPRGLPVKQEPQNLRFTRVNLATMIGSQSDADQGLVRLAETRASVIGYVSP